MKKTLKQGLLFLFFSFVIMTFCSENSFLYPFNTEPDVSCFYLTAKSILHGKTLYKDIYEQKGLCLYLLYMLAYLIDSHSYIGVYIVEIVANFIFIFFSFKTIQIISHKEKISAAIAIISGTLVCVNDSFQEGGFAEEFFLPILMVIVYLAVRYYAEIYPKRIPGVYTVLIGALSGFIFWAKYSSLGLVIGLGIYVLVQHLYEKRYKEIIFCFLELLLGFMIVTIPVLGYFYYNNALADLFEAYFYNLLVIYGEYFELVSGINNFVRFFVFGSSVDVLLAKSAILSFAFVCFCFGMPKSIPKKVNRVLQAMFWGSFILTAYGIVYNHCYQVIVLFVFFPIGLYCLYEVITCSDKVKIRSVLKSILIFVNEHYRTVFFALGFLSFCVYLICGLYSPVPGVICCCLLWLLLWLITKMNRLLEGRVSKTIYLIAKYGVLLFLWLIYKQLYSRFYYYTWVDYFNLMLPTVILAAIYLVVDDFVNERLEFLKRMANRVVMFSKKTTQFYLEIFACVCFLIVWLGNSLPYMFWNKEDTPIYVISQYIKEQGIDNPIIITFDLCDMGLYNILEMDPPVKYPGWYNNNIPECQEMRDDLFDNQKADYILTTNKSEETVNTFPNYQIAIKAKEYPGSESANYFVLFEKKK